MNILPVVHAYDVYAKLLFPLGYGHPLWIPEPGSEGEILIGDVGFIDAGRFFRLFNIFRSARDAANANGVPRDFHPLYLPPNQVVEGELAILRPICVGLQSTEENAEDMFELECVDDQGAFLLLKDLPTQEKLLLSRRLIKNYMLPNCEEWAAFARSGLKPDDIRLVSGWVKTDRWFMGAVTQNGCSAKLRLDGNFTFRTTLKVARPQPPDMDYGYRVGPAPWDTHNGTDALDDELPRNQCVFVNYYKLKTRLLFIKDFEGAAEPKDLQARRDNDNPGRVVVQDTVSVHGDTSDALQPASVPYKPWDPVDFVLDYILLHSEAKVAFAGTEDLVSLCGIDIPDDIPAYLERILPDIEVDDDGVGSLSFEMPVLHHGSIEAQSSYNKLADNIDSSISCPVDANEAGSVDPSMLGDNKTESRKHAPQGLAVHLPKTGACVEWACLAVENEVARVQNVDAARAIACA